MDNLRFVPSLLVVIWAEEKQGEADSTRDFADMVSNWHGCLAQMITGSDQTAKLVEERTIMNVSKFAISSNSTNLDNKFEEFLATVELNLEDRLSLSVTWKGVC